MDTKADTTRRGFLGAACAAATCGVGACAAVPVVSYLIPREEAATTGPIKVARSSHIPDGAAVAVKVGLTSILVIRLDGKLSAVKSKCTHLGCVVKWNEKEKLIKCPCHNATFAADGTKPTTPAELPLPPLPVTEADNQVIVTF
jgi:cytochrome b6-f complex iron-sulfur subunit